MPSLSRACTSGSLKPSLLKLLKLMNLSFKMHCSDAFIVEASGLFGCVLLKGKSLVGAFDLSGFRAIVSRRERSEVRTVNDETSFTVHVYRLVSNGFRIRRGHRRRCSVLRRIRLDSPSALRADGLR